MKKENKGLNNYHYILLENVELNAKYFYDDTLGTMKDFSFSSQNENFMLSDIDNIIKGSLKILLKNDNYYLCDQNNNQVLYLDKTNYHFAQAKTEQEFSQGKIEKGKYYCLRHYGPYETLIHTYTQLLKKIKADKKEIIGLPIEKYLYGRWNKEKTEEYITDIMIPIKSESQNNEMKKVV